MNKREFKKKYLKIIKNRTPAQQREYDRKCVIDNKRTKNLKFNIGKRKFTICAKYHTMPNPVTKDKTHYYEVWFSKEQFMKLVSDMKKAWQKYEME